MNGIVLLHAAGVRLGTVRGRSRERLAAFEHLVQAAEAEAPGALLVAGGLVGASVASQSALEPLERGLKRLREAEVPVVVAPSRQERRGEAPSPLDWLASRGLIRLVGEEVDLGARLAIVGPGVLDRRRRERNSRKRLVLLLAEPVKLASRELERFAYVAAGGRPAREKCAAGMHDPGPLTEASPGHDPVFLRVHLGSGAPRVEEVASGAPRSELLELDVTDLAEPDQVVARAVAAAGSLGGRPRRLRLRLVGEPSWREESIDCRVMASRIARALGGVEVEAELRTGLRLGSGQGLPADATLEAIEEAVLQDLLMGSAQPPASGEGLAALAAESLKGLAGSDPQERKKVAERLDAFRRAEVDGAR